MMRKEELMDLILNWATDCASNLEADKIKSLAETILEAMPKPLDVDEVASSIEEQIAYDMEISLEDGSLSPENYVIKNREILHQIVTKALKSSKFGRQEKPTDEDLNRGEEKLNENRKEQ